MQIRKNTTIIERFKGMKIKIYYSVGDPISFCEGTLEEQDTDGILLKSGNKLVYIPWASVVCFESEQ